jgi:hypothetical protein
METRHWSAELCCIEREMLFELKLLAVFCWSCAICFWVSSEFHEVADASGSFRLLVRVKNVFPKWTSPRLLSFAVRSLKPTIWIDCETKLEALHTDTVSCNKNCSRHQRSGVKTTTMSRFQEPTRLLAQSCAWKCSALLQNVPRFVKTLIWFKASA